MSSRPYLSPFPVITAGDMSTATITSSVTILTQLARVSYQASWTGSSPIGVLAVQVSNDYSILANGAVNNTGTWTTIQSTSISGNSGNGTFDVVTGFYAIRLLYTKTSGTGTLNATISGKV